MGKEVTGTGGWVETGKRNDTSKPFFLPSTDAKEGMKKERIAFEKLMRTYARDVFLKATWISRNLAVALQLAEPAPQRDEVVSQGKALFQHYVYVRLEKENFLSHKVRHLGSYGRPSDVAKEIAMVGAELERMHPELYTSVVGQAKMAQLDEAAVRKTLQALAEELCKGRMTWGRVVALFALGGALARDCCRKGRSELVACVVDAFVKVTQRHLAGWVVKQGGWNVVLKAFSPSENTRSLWAAGLLFATASFVATLPLLLQLT